MLIEQIHNKLDTSSRNTNIEEMNNEKQVNLIENIKTAKRKKRKESKFLQGDTNEDDEPLSKVMRKESKSLETDENVIFSENKSLSTYIAIDVTENAQDVEFWKKFSKSLKEGLAVEAVQYLLLDIKDRDVVAEYLEAGGSALRIVEVLDKAEDKKNTSLACTVFSAVRLLILKCMSKFPLLETSTEQTCKHILHTYGTMLYDILTTSLSFREKKIVLCLLAAMATMNLTLANEVLVIFNTLNGKHIDRLATHSTFSEDKSVRIYFLHLILAFFSHGRSHLIKMLLSLKNTMRSVSRGLIQDDATTVGLILTALQDNILDSDAIIKTVKIHTFNTHVLLDIISLYKWQGPKSKKASKKRKAEPEDEVDGEIVPSEVAKREFVQDSVHKFLTRLLTNHKLGVIFQDPSIGTSGKRCNDLAYSVLKVLEKEKYWKCDLVRDLTAKALEACPDLVCPVLNLLVGTFEPAPSGSWLKSVQFLQEVVNNINEEICLSPMLNIKQLSNVVISMVFNTPVCSMIATGDCLNHPHPTVRLQGVTTLLCCFHKLKHLVSVVKQRYVGTPENFNNFKSHIVDFITKNIKSTPLLVKAFQLGLDGEIYGVHAPSALDYYTELVDMFLVCYEVNPTTLQNEPELINTLANFGTVESDLLNIKLAKLVFLLNPAHSPLTEFEGMIEILVNLLGSEPIARSVLKDILSSSNLFNGNECEVSVWVHCLQLEAGNRSVTKLFLNSLKRTVEDAVEIARILSGAKEIAAKKNKKKGERKELDWDELAKLSSGVEQQQNQFSIKSFSVSPLVPAIVFTLEQSEYSRKDVKDFVVNLFSHVLHAQGSPEAIYYLIEDCSVKVMKHIKRYVSEWTADWPIEDTASATNNMVQKFLSLLHLDSPEYKICKALYDAAPEVSVSEVCVDLDADRIMLLLRMVVFHISQLTSKHCATDCIVQRGITLVESLLSSLDNNIPHVQQSLISHPALIDNFKPFDNGCANNLTQIALMLIKCCKTDHFKAPYKRRMIEKIKQALIEREIVSDNVDNLMKTLEVLSVPPDDAQFILKQILYMEEDKSRLMWLEVAEYMLVTVTRSSASLSADIVKRLAQHTGLHEAAALYLAEFPHQIALINTDLLVARQKELSRLTELVLQFDDSGAVLTRLLNNNKHKPEVVFPALAAASCHLRFKTVNYQIIHNQINKIQDALKDHPHPSWLLRHSAFIGTLLKNQKNLECLNNLRDYFVQEWATLQVTETLLDIAEPVFANTQQQTTLVKMLLPTLLLMTTPNMFDRCGKLCNHIQRYVQMYPQSDWSCIGETEEWKEWCTLALKYGEDPNLKAPFLLNTLSTLCSSDNSNLDTLLEMVFSHSQFLNAMIWKTKTKYELLQLLLKLITLKPSLAHSNHVPLYLSAYTASLSDTDQITIQLLQLYEKHGIGLSYWRPYFWGEAAIGYYSLRNKATPSLLHAAKSNQVFSLFNQKMVETTIARFPFSRNLEVEVTVESDKDVYDPAFFLPLLTELLASNEVIKIRNVTESGALAITICALSSQHKRVRSAAYVVIARFYQHLVSQNSDSLCLQFVEAVYKGVCSMNQDVPQLPSITTTFLARTQLVLTDSSHPMYKALGNFIIVKPELNFAHIPEWSRLFWSTEHESRIHQEWILEILRDSISQGKDVGLVISNNVIPILMDYYSSVLSYKKIKLLILEVILSVFKASYKKKSLCHTLAVQNGMSSWLSHIIYSHKLNPLLLTTLISLLSILNKYMRCPSLVLNLVLRLLTKFPTKEQAAELLKVVDSLPPSVLSLSVVDTLIQYQESSSCAKQCRDILQFGVLYQRMKDDEEDHLTQYLKNIVIKYVKRHVERQQSVKVTKTKSRNVKIVQRSKNNPSKKKKKT